MYIILYYFIEDQDYTKLKIGKTADIHMSVHEVIEQSVP